MPLAQLSIDLVAKVASFESDLKRAAKAAEDQSTRMARAFDTVKVGLAGLAAGISVGAIASFVRDTNDAIDALNDAADATGATVESISALDGVARRTGANLDTVTGILVRFNQALGDPNPDSPGAKALQAIGLRAEELRRLDPADALQRTAQALERFADDGNKARLIQELFGRSVREAAPFIKDLAEAGELNATVTKKQTAEAEKFNKEMFKFKANVEDLERNAISRLIVAVNDLADAFRLGREEGRNFFEIAWTRYRENLKNFYAVEPAERLLEVNRELEKTLANQAEARADNRGRFQPRIEELRAEQESLREVIRLRQRSSLFQEEEDRRPSVNIVEEDKDAERRRKEAEREAKAAARERQREAEEQRREELRIGELRNRLNGERFREEKENQKALDELIASINRREQERLERYLDDTPTRQLERQREEMEFLLKALNGELADESGKRIQITQQEYLEAVASRLNLVADATDKAKGFAEEFGLSFSSAFEDAIVKGESFSDVLKSLEQDILRIIVREQITEPLGNFISSGVDDFFGSLFPSAKGNVFMDAPGLSAYTNSVVSEPTLFPFAKGIGLMGEKAGSPGEAIMPLSRMPNGDLGVSVIGASPPVTVNIINQGTTGLQVTGQRQRVGADGGLNLDVLVEVIESRMADNVSNRSGALSRGLESGYGLRPSVL